MTLEAVSARDFGFWGECSSFQAVLVDGKLEPGTGQSPCMVSRQRDESFCTHFDFDPKDVQRVRECVRPT